MIVDVCRFEQDQELEWDRYVHRHPSATHCHLSAWRHAIQRSYGHKAFYLWAHEDGDTKGILPLVLIRSRLFGRSLVSLPFLDGGGVCADDHPTKIELCQQALRVCEDYRVDFLDLRHREPSGLDLPLHGSKVTLLLDLAESPDRMWDRFDGKLRNQIRKAQKSGLTVSWSGLEGIDAFYDVFASNMRDLGSPVHSRRFFAAVVEEFSEGARLILVKKGSQTIGGAVCLSFKDTLLVPWASSLREYLSICPNNLLYWEVIRWGCEKGYQRLDFGRSSPGTGTYRFKKQWGTVEVPLRWQCLGWKRDRAAVVESGDPNYAWIVRIWKHLPVAITKMIGPVLRRHMSN